MLTRGGEFTSNSMLQLCQDNCIKQEFANIGTPSENGVVECKNQIVVEMARTMLAHQMCFILFGLKRFDYNPYSQ